MKIIYVKNKDLGFFTQSEIPVVRYDETSWCCGAEVTETGFCSDCKDNAEPRHEIVFCNHADPELEERHNQIDRIDEPDICWTDRVYICRRCQAYRFEGEEQWEDAPLLGVV